MIKLVWSRSAIMYTFTYQHQPGTRISCFLVIGAGDMTVSLIIFKMNVLLFYKYKYSLIQEFSEEPNADNIFLTRSLRDLLCSHYFCDSILFC